MTRLAKNKMYWTGLCILFASVSFSQEKWKLAYVHWQDTVNNESWINIMDLEGKNIQLAVNYPGSNWMPMASGDLIWFQITTDTNGKKRGLYKYDLRTKKETWMFDTRGLYMDIDYDHHTDMYAGGFGHRPVGRTKTQYDIFLFNEDGSVKEQITNDTAYNLEPCFSPDGKQIIFRSNRDRNPTSWGEFELYKINRDGTGITRLTNNPDTTKNVSRANSPRWMKNGKIIFTDYRDNNYRLMQMNADGSDLKALIPMDDLEQHGYDISPDGKLIAFTGRRKGARNFDIYIVNSDGSQLRQLTNDWKRKVQPIFINTH